jgi:putative SOS response-associated peptidase YedK
MGQSLQHHQGATGRSRPRHARCATRGQYLLPGVFPDYSAPIVRTAADGVRELAIARWGMPSPLSALKGRNSDSGVTNVRNVASWSLVLSDEFVEISQFGAARKASAVGWVIPSHFVTIVQIAPSLI